MVKSRTIVTSALIVVSWLATGCASTESGAGANLGAVVGGLLGGAGCLAKGRSASDCAPATIVGVVAGAALGGIAGTQLEKRRIKGETELAFIQRNNTELASRNKLLKQELTQAKSLIIQAKQQRDTLKKSVKSVSAKEKNFGRMTVAAKKKQKKIDQQITKNKKELADQEKLLASVKKSGTYSGETEKLEIEISSLREQIGLLEETELELASVSSTKF